jgi:hypothetical protein
MQSCDLDRPPVVKEYEDASGFRMYCRMIRCRNDILASIARSNRECFKRSRVQEFSNSGNHELNLLKKHRTSNNRTPASLATAQPVQGRGGNIDAEERRVVSARRQNQHARRPHTGGQAVRYPDKTPPLFPLSALSPSRRLTRARGRVSKTLFGRKFD